MKNNELRLAPTFVTQKNKELLEMKTDLLLLILLIPFMFVVGCRKNNNGNGEVQDTIATNMPADTVSTIEEIATNMPADTVSTIEENVEVTKSSSWEDLMPQSERNLIDVLKKAWEKDELDYTDAEKYRLVRERKNVISNGYQMTDWIGTVESVQYYPNANEIELEISLHEGKDMRHYIRVGTGASKDLKVNRTRIIQKLPHTIREGSSLFDIALDLEPGNTVKFTGTFSLESYQWSVYENPLDDIESLAFRTKFSKLEKLD